MKKKVKTIREEKRKQMRKEEMKNKKIEDEWRVNEKYDRKESMKKTTE